MRGADEAESNGAAPYGRGGLRLLGYAVVLLLLPVLVACGAGEESATTDEGIPTATPAAIDELPADLEEAALEVSEGDVAVSELILTEGQPTILHVVNHDDEEYSLRIEDVLADNVALPAGDTIEVSFTTPKAGRYDGALLAATDDSVVAEFAVVVQEPGGLVD